MTPGTAELVSANVVKNHQVVRDLIAVVRMQLPRTLLHKLSVDVHSDAAQLRPVAIFGDAQGNCWRCLLEASPFEGVELNCVVPDTFLARLCVEVK